MRRADRLFQIIQHVRAQGVTTAAALAEALEVSQRTIYRDVRDLTLSGVPLEGEAGVGYRLGRGFDLPPLMFTPAEIEALVLGTRVVMSWGDPALGRAAAAALSRVETALPSDLRRRLDETRLYAPGFHVPPALMERLGVLRGAVESRRRVWLQYRDAGAAETERTVRPLGLFFWGPAWSLCGWCELREDFRNFRLDRVVAMRVLADRFEDEPGRTLADYMRREDEDPAPTA